MLAVVGRCRRSLPFAFAATPLAYTTPKAIAEKITGGIPQLVTGNAAVPTVITASTCKGLGAAHQGKFKTFRCKATYLNGQKTANVWVRARPGGQFCAASTGLDACPVAAPTIGDPRVCNKAPAPPTADPNSCALGSAILALNRAMSVKFAPPGSTAPPPLTMLNLSCTGKNLKWHCVFSTSADRTVHTGRHPLRPGHGRHLDGECERLHGHAGGALGRLPLADRARARLHLISPRHRLQ